MDEIDNIIILNDEDGNDVRFEFLDAIEYEGEEYVILMPCEEAEEDGTIVILKVEESGDEETDALVSVSDEATLNALYEIFKEKFKDEFDFVD